MCKKILKVQKQTTFKDLQNAIKEFEVLHSINHPCICKSYFINMNEVIGVNEDEEITTVALFLEYYEYNLDYCLSKNMLDNTTKTKIVVEIAFGMSHVHKLGMIHRDLKISNIMLNKNYDAKIIIFKW